MGVGSWTARITEEVSDRRRTRLLEDFAAPSDEMFPNSSEKGTAEGADEGQGLLRVAPLRLFLENVEGGTAERGEDKICGQLRRKTLKLLVSVRILDEAVDIPQCDSVFYSNVPTSK